MQRFMLKSKIHRATVTDADLHYEGSITIDPLLMKEADILPYETVAIYNISNGERFSTYAIPGDPDSGVICLANEQSCVTGTKASAVFTKNPGTPALSGTAS